MTGDELRELFVAVLGGGGLDALVEKYGVQQRERKRDVYEFIVALILAGGTHDGGRQYDILRTYLANGGPKVARGTFYSWFTEPLRALLVECLEHAIRFGAREPSPARHLGGVSDWHVVDSTTIRLDDTLVDTFPGAGDYAALEIDKEWSVGTGNLVAYEISPAREHDSPHLTVDERRRGTGLLADLGYVSIQRLSECEMYDVRYVVRLKETWKPKVERIVRGALTASLTKGADFDTLLQDDLVLAGQAVDADVVVGRGTMKVRSRLIAIPTPKGYCFFLTNLPRKTHGPLQVGEVYRVRWKIELDDKVEKAGARIDDITAHTEVSVRILVLATLLNATIARTIVQRDKLAIVAAKPTPDAPAGRGAIHPISLMRALSASHANIASLLKGETPKLGGWEGQMDRLRTLSQDPNWRRSPSVLDRIQGLTAPPGRKRDARAS